MNMNKIISISLLALPALALFSPISSLAKTALATQIVYVTATSTNVCTNPVTATTTITTATSTIVTVTTGCGPATIGGNNIIPPGTTDPANQPVYRDANGNLVNSQGC